MALGAVLFSVPFALAVSLYGSITSGLAAGHTIGFYAIVGTAILTSFTIVHGIRLDDFR
jgi:hypothetical protein